MALLLLKDLPRYECILKAAEHFPDLDPSACEAYLHLLRVAGDVFHAREANLNRHGLSHARFTVLMLLIDKSRNEPQPGTPAALADQAGVTRATMTGLIDTLERDGLVRRKPDHKDRRMMMVHLTPKGHRLLRGVLPVHFQWMAELLRPLSESERKTLVDLLMKISRQTGRDAGQSRSCS